MMPHVGIWPTQCRLIAVGLTYSWAPRRLASTPLTPPGYARLLDELRAKLHVVDLVVPNTLADNGDLAVMTAALACAFTLWIVEEELVEAIDLATGHLRSSPTRRAAILARLATIPSYRNHLRVARSRLRQQQLDLR